MSESSNPESKPIKFVVSQPNGDEDFKPGFRSNSLYRDLGVEEATNGMVLAHVVRANGKFPEEGVAGPHRHLTQFHFCYMLAGWQKMRFKGQSEVILQRAGTAWVQPADLAHEVLDFSDDREILEIILPARYKTIDEDYGNEA